MTSTVQSLYERFVKTTQSMPNHPAVVYFNAPHWIPIHYQALHHSIRALAGFLHQNGLSKGDRIGIYMQNRPEWVMTDMAAYALGAVVVPIYPTLSEHDVHYIINDSDLKVVVVDNHDRFQMSSRVIGGHNALTTVITTRQFSDIQAKKIEAPHVTVQRDDLASIVYKKALC
jgi:long-chain acyl-CoA synthetase